jgi:hypothetical protein
MTLTLPSHLAQFTVQEIQLELLRRVYTEVNRDSANELVTLLLQHSDLWEAILVTEQFHFFKHDALRSLRYPLITKLRSLLKNHWPADTICVLTETEEKRDSLIRLWKDKIWDNSIAQVYDAEECERMLRSCGLPDTYRIFFYWND